MVHEMETDDGQALGEDLSRNNKMYSWWVYDETDATNITRRDFSSTNDKGSIIQLADIGRLSFGPS